MNGNVTQDGIQADLEWMRRVGIGGVQRFDAGGVMASYAFIKPRLIVGDVNWKEAIRKAAELTDRLGLDHATATSPGWSLTGGPWVKPAQAMKKYVWSETLVQGGQPFTGKLPQPPAATGSFQDATASTFGGSANKPQFYSDSLVIAYRLSAAERSEKVPIAITSSSGPLDGSLMRDGSFAKTQIVTGAEGAGSAWVVISYDKPTTVRSLVLGFAGRAASAGERKPIIEISNDGLQWQAGTTLSGHADAVSKVYAFKPLTARHFRLTLPPEPPPPSYIAPPGPPSKAPVKLSISELALRSEATVDRFVDKAGFGAEPINFSEEDTPAASSDAVIGSRDVIDLTRRMAADGTLRWTPPAGRWRILRLGYSLTGKENGPAQAEATGLEVDKLNAGHVRSYVDAYLSRFTDATGPGLIGAKGLQALVADSWEAGLQNWTDDMPAQFRARRGYDLAPWAPVLTGRIVRSAADSERFLWDFRRTIQDLTAQHYEVVADELHKRGMSLYAEAQGDNWRALGDGIEMKSRVDVPMSEYWFRSFAAGPGQPSLKTDMKEAASVAHLYGKPLAAAESLTVASNTPWAYAPSQLKPVIDEIFAYGINRVVLHTSVHQPVIGKRPGIALGPFGQYINRNETWAEQAKPFFDYIARASYLLQQGRYVADVAYFYGDDRPLVSLFQGKYDQATDRYLIEVPFGTGFDFINSETLQKATGVDGNALTTSGGMRYRLLYLGPDTRSMTLGTLQRLETLVRQGVVLVGGRPRRRLGMTGSDQAFEAIAARMWGDSSRVRQLGGGRIYPTRSVTEALAAENIAPDVSISGAPDGNVLQLHRRLGDGTDVYFLSNRKARDEQLEVTFRSVGRRPELWDANTGSATPLSYSVRAGRTVVRVKLAAQDSGFIVFRTPTTATTATIPAPLTSTIRTLTGPWPLIFAPDLGAPAKAVLPSLTSWSENTDPGVRYFSGTATYPRELVVPADWKRSGRRLILDLGEVHEVAQLFVNGRDLGILWKAPYRLDITDAVKAGSNQLDIKVTNLWPNRMIGDLQPGNDRRITWTEYSPLFAQYQWKTDGKLLPSGLMGPVRILAVDSERPGVP